MEPNLAVDLIREALIARQPLVALFSYEEERVEATLARVTRGMLKDAPLAIWAATTGLMVDDKVVPDSTDPLDALDLVRRGESPAIFLFRDLHVHFDDPRVVRKLRDTRRQMANRSRYLFMQSPPIRLPQELRRDVHVVDIPLPTASELERVATRRLAGMQIVLKPDAMMLVVTALRGLTINEAGAALNVAFYGRESINQAVLTSLREQKAQLARKDGILEFVPQQWSLQDVGGLAVMKDWLAKRRRLFEDDSVEARQLAPRGVLVMGIPGCGKSLSIKAIGSYWQLPLFRLDMGQVFSGTVGGPEESFARALRMMEQVAPAILWLDEIENGISSDTEGSDAGVKNRIFATFLTWMQEKPEKVFVAATANRIDRLPAELLRKGRFDQVFFIDLPTEDERAQIFRVHLRRRGVADSIYNAMTLSKATRNWNGAEIEQCVVSAMTEAYAAKEPLNEDHLFFQISHIVPLSTTMSEQIKGIKSWAHQRAIHAS